MRLTADNQVLCRVIKFLLMPIRHDCQGELPPINWRLEKAEATSPKVHTKEMSCHDVVSVTFVEYSSG